MKRDETKQNSSTFIEFHKFLLSLMPIQNFICNISVIFKFQKSQSHNTKAMSKDRKVKIAVTYSVVAYKGFHYLISGEMAFNWHRIVSFDIARGIDSICFATLASTM